MTALPDERAWLTAVADFLATPVPDDVRERGVWVVADVLSAATAGAAASGNAQVVQAVAFEEGPSTVIGTDRRAGPGWAALLNGAASITPEVEEGHNSGGHVGAGIVVGAFALAEQADADGETLVDACVKAYELCARIENAIYLVKDIMNETTPWLVRDPHSTWTTIGPAVAGALVLGGDDEQVMEAFRLGANLAVVSMWDAYREGPPARNYTAGFSAQAGVNAALLAVAGLAGSRAAMYEVYDPLREMKGEAFDRSFAELGEVWEIESNYYKFTPSCRYTHPPLTALSDISDEVRVDELESIDVYTYAAACDLDYTDYETMTGAKFSIPYVLARHLSEGDLWLSDFEEPAVSDADTRTVAQHVHLHHDEAYDETFPNHWSARVVVTHTDGSTVEAECIDAVGDHRNFPGKPALFDKFERLLSHRLDERGPAALDALLDVRSRSVRDVGVALRTA